MTRAKGEPYPCCQTLDHADGVCDCAAIDEYVETARREGHAAGVAAERARWAAVVREFVLGVDAGTLTAILRRPGVRDAVSAAALLREGGAR